MATEQSGDFIETTVANEANHTQHVRRSQGDARVAARLKTDAIYQGSRKVENIISLVSGHYTTLHLLESAT